MNFSFYDNASNKQKLIFVLVVAFFIRVVAAVFSGGYAMHDDHFVVIETPSSWAYGHDSGAWFPETQENLFKDGKIDKIRPQGHSLTYAGAHYFLFKVFRSIHINDPAIQMLIVRLIHALLGVLSVFLIYHLSVFLSTTKKALTIAWISALGWAFAFLSVRNLVEVVCIPFMLAAVLFALKGTKEKAVKFGVLAGVLMALAVSIRYQTVVFFGVFGLLLLLSKHYKLAFSVLGSFVLSFVLLQGLPDYLIWGYPFAEMIEYFNYNSSDARFDYASGLSRNFGLNYIVLLAFITVPFLGVLWIIGFFTQWKKRFLLFWPTAAFLLLHMSYINTQERFVFPIMFFVLILGYLGWTEIVEKRETTKKKPLFWRSLTLFSWTINTILLLAMSTYFVKKSRVESAMSIDRNDKIEYIVQENIINQETPLIPLFYAQKWETQCYDVHDTTHYEILPEIESGKTVYLFFYGQEKLAERISYAKNKFPLLTFVGQYDPSFIDRIVHKLNPVNKNETISVYRIETK